MAFGLFSQFCYLKGFGFFLSSFVSKVLGFDFWVLSLALIFERF